ncbi:hypothetical protein [Parabacteroides pacaensis]|uniref:hypothetical protein n=1 Tax=Parabacteroides pacaensis TaxID=2086575 RepID=UPI000D0E7CAA|nr:hypothetical protein [Parabacteroides pacaensis]
MKKNNFLSPFVGLGALTLALSLNFIYASNNYGISDNSLSIQVLAQTNSSGDGSGSGSGSGSGTSTGPGIDKRRFAHKIITEDESVSISCDHTYHIKEVQPGVNISCLGAGTLDCEKGFIPVGQSSTTKESCPGSSCILRE